MKNIFSHIFLILPRILAHFGNSIAVYCRLAIAVGNRQWPDFIAVGNAIAGGMYSNEYGIASINLSNTLIYLKSIYIFKLGWIV